jgi:predicted AlkP superfamily phosphohydrolase/phosphomutase
MHTLILGFDSFDPHTFERLSSQGKLPHLTKLVDQSKYARFEVSDPPQTEVSWTSIATGLNPGGHGIFDFVHRDPETYTPFVSLLPTQRNVLGVQFVRPYSATTIFEEATRQGFPSTALWWPALFPARPESPVRTIPGLGTPDLQGRLGVGTLFTMDNALADVEQKTEVKVLQKIGKDRYTASLSGPISKKHGAIQNLTTEMQIELIDAESARLNVGKQSLQLILGKWSPIFEITFKAGAFISIRAITKAILTQISPEIRLYLLPLQIHPLSSPWRYATPPSFIKEVWKTCGPYLTLGWPQDTTGLEEGCISDSQFLELCESIFASRERTLMHLSKSFHEGLLAIIFDSLDRIQHMFWRDRPDIVESWYIKLDGLVGRVQESLEKQAPRARLLVLSDHGFTDFTYKVHLDRWLVENGYLLTKDDGSTGDKEHRFRGANGHGSLKDVDWSQSRAYAVGLNSLYINLYGREGLGSVSPEKYQALAVELRDNLLNWRGPDGILVVQRALLRDEVFFGPLKPYAPDILVGYSPGYRASSETGLGKWKDASIELNRDHWGADHCIDSQSVPGVLFSSQGLEGLAKPSFRDIPMLSIGKEIEQSGIEPPPPPSSASGEGQNVIEERLKSLGYL